MLRASTERKAAFLRVVVYMPGTTPLCKNTCGLEMLTVMYTSMLCCVVLCRMQQISLSFHFAVEQRARSFLNTFFGFNGTAGVWRRRYEMYFANA